MQAIAALSGELYPNGSILQLVAWLQPMPLPEIRDQRFPPGTRIHSRNAHSCAFLVVAVGERLMRRVRFDRSPDHYADARPRARTVVRP